MRMPARFLMRVGLDTGQLHLGDTGSALRMHVARTYIWRRRHLDKVVSVAFRPRTFGSRSLTAAARACRAFHDAKKQASTIREGRRDGSHKLAAPHSRSNGARSRRQKCPWPCCRWGLRLSSRFDSLFWDDAIATRSVLARLRGAMTRTEPFSGCRGEEKYLHLFL